MIKAATRDSLLFKLPPVVDQLDRSNEIAEVLIKALEWNMLSREWNLTVSDLEDLHGQSKALLEALKECLPDRIGGAAGWCFEKAHSILHKVREIIMWGWSENTSCQGPEHAHIDLIKNVAHLTNNKDVFLCILRYHCRRGFVQQYEQMLEDMLDQGDSQPAGASQVSRKIDLDHEKIASVLNGDRNFSVACELGVRYPTLRAMLNRGDLNLRIAVSSYKYILCIFVTYV